MTQAGKAHRAMGVGGEELITTLVQMLQDSSLKSESDSIKIMKLLLTLNCDAAK